MKPGPMGYILEAMGLTALLALIALPVYFYSDLPEFVPKHFNFSGKVDAYGDRNFIWMLPAIGTAVYIFMTLLNRVPHIFNYPVEVTEDNAERLYSEGTGVVRFLKVVLLLEFFTLNYKIIQVALKRSTGPGELFIPVSAGLLLFIVAISVYRMRSIK